MHWASGDLVTTTADWVTRLRGWFFHAWKEGLGSQGPLWLNLVVCGGFGGLPEGWSLQQLSTPLQPSPTGYYLA